MWTLRFPFEPTNEVQDLEEPAEFDFRSLHAKVWGTPKSLTLDLSGFATEKEAGDFVPHVWGGLAASSVERGSGFLASTELGGGNQPHVLRTGSSGMIMTALQPSFVMSWPREKFLDSLNRGLAAAGAATAMHEERLRLALELYFSSQMESLSSKFLTQIMALEVLSAPVVRHQTAIDLLDRWRSEVVSARAENKTAEHPDAELEHALESLQQSALFARESSKRSKVRRLVLDMLTHLPAAERKERGDEIVEAYDHRGSLVHSGSLERQTLVNSWIVVQQTLKEILCVKLGLNPISPF